MNNCNDNSKKEINKAILCITFNDYTAGGGGVQKVIFEHQELFNNSGYEYFCIFPVKKLILKDSIMLFCYWGLIINGRFNGIYSKKQIIEKIYELELSNIYISCIHIHHLMYCNLNDIQDFVDYLSDVPIFFFIHDYYSLCRNYSLLKNGQSFCGYGGVVKAKCISCRFYNKTTLSILKRMEYFFGKNSNRVTFISPSDITRKIWTSYYKRYADKIIVIGHEKVKEKTNHIYKRIKYGDRIHVGYLGRPVTIKGWDVWNSILCKFGQSYYDFYVFNDDNEDDDPRYKHIYVNVTAENKNAMVQALIESNIDVVLIWSNIPETYCFTYFESFCADCYVLTYKDSGNVACEVKSNGNGIVFDNENKLFEELSDYDQMIVDINRYRQDGNLIPGKFEVNRSVLLITQDLEKDYFKKCKPPVGKQGSSILLKILRKIYKIKGFSQSETNLKD